VKNGYKYKFYLADEECIEKNPGDTINKLFFDYLPTLKKNYGTIVSWIETGPRRTTFQRSPTPKIVFTNYANPLPAQGVK
jgi:hypothetical protein